MTGGERDQLGARDGGAPLHVITIASRAEVAEVSLLAESVARHHPDACFSVVLVDGLSTDAPVDLPATIPPATGRPATVLPLDAIGLDPALVGGMVTWYDQAELPGALKPFVLRHLLDGEAGVALYLDPDVVLYDRLDGVVAGALDTGVALVPQVLAPVPPAAREVLERRVLQTGQFNLGMVAVSAAGRPFLDWWAEHTELEALIEPALGLHGDQRWIDAVPALFPHTVVRDPGCHLGWWNLHERPLEDTADGGWTVNGAPLRSVSFRGHDVGDPFRVTDEADTSAWLPVDRMPSLRRLLRARADRRQAVTRPAIAPTPPYRWRRSDDGVLLDRALRRYHWRAARDARASSDVAPPPPAFGGEPGVFVRWWREPIVPGGAPRHVHARWHERPDLHGAFPDPLGASAGALAMWAATDDGFQRATSAPLAVIPPAVAGGWPGVNLVGYVDGQFGVGAAARMVGRMVRAAGLPVATTSLQAVHHRHDAAEPVLRGAPFDLSVLAVNPDQLRDLVGSPTFAAHAGRRRVGIWYWEVGVLPARVHGIDRHLDEVWCTTDFVRDALEPWVDRPVVKHPLVFESATERLQTTRADLGLPDDRFLFGFVYDHASVLARKNPLGLIDAYTRTFGPDDGAVLVLKSINRHHAPGDAARVAEAVAGRPDILLLDDHLSGIAMRALYQHLDAYVSLHRSEGLGLTIASAMLAGTPAIATGWSGNIEFMDDRSSVLIPYELTDVGPGADPYPPDACWAEPDRDAASAAMRRLFDDPDAARRLGAAGRAALTERHTAARAGDWFARKYDEIVREEHAA